MTESRKRKFGVALTMGLIQVFTIAGVIALGVVAYQQSERAADAEAVAAAEAAQRGQDIEALRDQVFELGETPVVAPPPPTPTADPDTPRNGRDGEDGKDGEDGADAPAPTSAQLLAAFQSFCEQFVCRGADGVNGRDGLDGAKGDKGDKGDPSTVPGPQGPPGPTCPDGYTTQTVWVPASDTETEIPTPRQAVICLPTPLEGEPTP